MNRDGYTLKLMTLTFKLTLIKRFSATYRLTRIAGFGPVVHVTGLLSR